MPVSCVHHWLIDSPNGPTTSGRCKRCGEEREFTTATGKSRWPDKGEMGLISAAKREEGVLGRIIRGQFNTIEGVVPLARYHMGRRRRGYDLQA